MPKDYFQGEHVEWTDLTKDERSRLRPIPIVGACAAGALVFVLLYLAFWPNKAGAEEIPALEQLGAEIKEFRRQVDQLHAKVRALRSAATDIPLHVHEQDGLTIRLMPGPCVDANSVAFLGEPYVSRARALESVWRMRDGTSKPFAGCWLALSAAEAGQEAFFLIFSDGDRYVVPKSEFLKKSGTSGA